jgi:hypothetical protein
MSSSPREIGPLAVPAPHGTDDDTVTGDVRGFARQVEKNSWLQAERHVTAAGFWGNFQWIAGGAAAVLAAAASGSAFNDSPTLAGYLALAAAASAALVTALRPGDVAAQHLASAASYNELQSVARDLWEFKLSADATEQRTQLDVLTSKWIAVTSGSPRVPRRLLRLTAAFNAKGDHYYPPPSWGHDA